MQKIDVLFIDDDEEFLYLIDRVTNKIDEISQCEFALNGKIAIKLLLEKIQNKEHLPKIMFVDINMPEMDGFEFLNHFQELRIQYPELNYVKPVVMLTSSTQESDREKALREGIANQYIIKPTSLEKLREVIIETILS